MPLPMVFGSFNLHYEFFAKHQLNYLADVVRVLVYTGLPFNFYDVLVMAMDEQVLREQVEKASQRIDRDLSVTTQSRLNFEMSVKNLYQSFQDRERVPKIQGLLNECMTFLDDELSIITGPYEDSRGAPPGADCGLRCPGQREFGSDHRRLRTAGGPSDRAPVGEAWGQAG